MFEQFFTCPYCWIEISVLIDMSIPKQVYFEDCESCCNPMQIKYECKDNYIEFFEAISIEQ